MNNGTRPIEWAILIATILGFIIQPILTYILENKRIKRLKELEAKETQNEKRIKAAEELIGTYRELFSNSQASVEKNLNSLDESIKDNLKSIEKWGEYREWIKKVIKEMACSDCRKKFKPIVDDKKNPETSNNIVKLKNNYLNS